MPRLQNTCGEIARIKTHISVIVSSRNLCYVGNYTKHSDSFLDWSRGGFFYPNYAEILPPCVEWSDQTVERKLGLMLNKLV